MVRVGRDLRRRCTRARRYGFAAVDFVELRPREPLDDEPQAAVGQLEHLVDVAGGADRIQSSCCGSSTVGVALGEDANQLAAGDGFVDQPDGALARDRERHERVRKQDRVAKRKDRELVRKIERPIGCRKLFDLERLVVGHLMVERPGRAAASAARPFGPGDRLVRHVEEER